MNERLLTIAEAAELLAVSGHTLRHLARRGCIPAVRVGRSLRFDRQVLLAAVAEGRAAWPQRKPAYAAGGADHEAD